LACLPFCLHNPDGLYTLRAILYSVEPVAGGREHMAEDKQNEAPKIDVAYVAHLARLYLDESEIETFQGQMEQIVDYVKQIEGLDVADVEPTSHAVAVTNVFRDDRSRPGIDRDRVLANAPQEANDQFVVPKIVE
jgi:aspartyl-tRNA(Asn)/glutamyl-tRNA(Gln) amidotransferase subunit C